MTESTHTAPGPDVSLPEESESPDGLSLVSEHRFSRKMATGYAALLGVLAGGVNLFLDVDFTLCWALLGWLGAAVITVVVLHEGVHGLVAALQGHRPIFGVKPPLVYMTLRNKVPRGDFVAIAVAPLIVLDLLFAGLYQVPQLSLFANLCFTINTIGAVGDVWIVLKLLPHERGTLVEDTKTGLEVWRRVTAGAFTGGRAPGRRGSA
ncbi:MAG: DUF3267 domain-containing protein [Planctomycetota bacterium]|nr:DUF3267 domain-containing protein [Planctomycetota bacterium]